VACLGLAPVFRVLGWVLTQRREGAKAQTKQKEKVHGQESDCQPDLHLFFPIAP
jgi:hypothetical protein